jgi:hypothetical protein
LPVVVAPQELPSVLRLQPEVSVSVEEDDWQEPLLLQAYEVTLRVREPVRAHGEA